jgi:hypothetical protein
MRLHSKEATMLAWLRQRTPIVRQGFQTIPQHTELLARYKHLRRVGLELNNKLVETLGKDVLEEGGKKLGILRRNTLVLDTQDEISVLMDFCLHDVRRRGQTAIERYLMESPPPADSDEMVILQANRDSWFTLLAVESNERGVGVHVRDLLRDEPLFLVDVGFSQTAHCGMVLACRVMVADGIAMTTGAALPVGQLSTAQQSDLVEGLQANLPGVDFRNITAEQASKLATIVIRSCLERGAADRIGYVDPGQMAERSNAPADRGRGAIAGRNDPCPCGSGKKFKRCCGTRR